MKNFIEKFLKKQIILNVIIYLLLIKDKFVIKNSGPKNFVFGLKSKNKNVLLLLTIKINIKIFHFLRKNLMEKLLLIIKNKQNK